MYNRLATKVIVDAGHGGSDPGAVGNGLQEKNLNLRAAQYMYQRLQELGIPSEITRNTDETLPKAQRIERILDLINNSEDVILVSNHINAGGGEGAEIVYALRNDDTLARAALENIGEKGQITRKIYQRRLPENPNLDYYYILRETGQNTEPILVEYGFIDNANDAAKLQNNLLDYVEGVVKAIAEYTNTPYTAPGQNDEFYTVRRGDTLYSIASRYNISVNTLKRINNLTSDVLQIGQVLRVKEQEEPEIPPTTNYEYYTVQKGDTLYSIASRYSTTVDELRKINNLTSNTLFIGQQLLVPTNEGTNQQPNQYITYTVVKGDSLWSISKRYGVTIDDIIQLNNLNTIDLKIGDTLLIPSTETTTETYTVKRGDSLWSIAKANNISVDQLKEANTLTSNLLSIGQILIIPR